MDNIVIARFITCVTGLLLIVIAISMMLDKNTPQAFLGIIGGTILCLIAAK